VGLENLLFIVAKENRKNITKRKRNFQYEGPDSQFKLGGNKKSLPSLLKSFDDENQF
jgi:hypothetical protein